MSARDAFGPNLRRIRIQRGISLDTIARETKVAVELWDALERNDFSHWPTGLFARAYIREYARILDLDPETIVDEFCRYFPHGDRRALKIVREQAKIVGHPFQGDGDALPAGVAVDRRDPIAKHRAHTSSTLLPIVNLFVRLRRAFGKA
jgi:transcriptional regulator with XRE-family HTH domain